MDFKTQERLDCAAMILVVAIVMSLLFFMVWTSHTERMYELKIKENSPHAAEVPR